MSLKTSVAAVVTALKTVPELRQVFDYPPESMSSFPSAIVYGRAGTMGETTYNGRARCDGVQHTIAIEVHLERQMLPKALEEAQEWPERMYALLVGMGSPLFLFPMTWELGALDYNRETHVGVYFEVTVKE